MKYNLTMNHAAMVGIASENVEHTPSVYCCGRPTPCVLGMRPACTWLYGDHT